MPQAAAAWKHPGVPTELPELIVADAGAWLGWLSQNHAASVGVVLVLAKKGAAAPTTLTYEEALEEALCHGWIDGQVRRRDEATYRQRFTPRRPSSSWSARNVAIVERLRGEGRMRPAGLQAVERAVADGRWESAYEGQARIEVPEDLRCALAAEPRAAELFERLNAQNRYAILYRVQQARRAQTRARRIERFVEMLAAGQTPHPQR